MSSRLIEILTSSFFKILIPGIKITIPLTVLSFAVSLVLGLLLALVQVAELRFIKDIARFYIWIFRGTPLIVQLFIIFFGLPSLGITLEAFPSAVMAFGMNLGAYNAEVFRAAILAIPKGQMEAAYMIGLNYPMTMMRVVLPQSFPIAFPSLFNNLIGLLKDTSLASSITVIELFTAAQQIAARTYEPFALYCEAALIYLIFSTALTWLQDWIERKLKWKSGGSEDAGNQRTA
ncbi:MAG: amino acid ABC transporter permease [Lachnospiraceae bacterium]|nr:amino acid ABC transporter permease [Lachnospiraceae bacterium]